MSPFMIFTVAYGCKAFTAVVALVRALTCVGPQMYLEIPLFCEISIASSHWALVKMLHCVNRSYVEIKARGSSEGLVATIVGAGMSCTIHVNLFMITKVLFPLKGFRTTRELALEVTS